MSQRSAPSFTCFLPSPLPGALTAEGQIRTRYRVERAAAVRGAEVSSIEPGQLWWRLESGGNLAVPSAPFVGSTQHVVYTGAAERSDLTRVSTGPLGPCAVLIPIRKSAAWWALAQDERQAMLAGGARSGHIPIGRPFAARIYRRLYHARYLPGSEWDFLTYFEFPESSTGTFRELLAMLRDPAQNPEWAYVDRELEIWMRLSPQD
jgi:hypothetical protein